MNRKGEKKSEISLERESFIDKVKGFMLSTRVRVIFSILFFSFALCLLISCCSYFFTGEEDFSIVNLPSTEQQKLMDQVSNALGLPGAKISHLLMNKTFGLFSFCIIAIIFGISFLFLPLKKEKISIIRFFFYNLFCLGWGCVTIAFIQNAIGLDIFFKFGGQYGTDVIHYLRTYLKDTGTIILLVVSFVIFCILVDRNFILRLIKMWDRLKMVLVRSKIQKGEGVKIQNGGDENVKTIEPDTITIDETPAMGDILIKDTDDETITVTIENSDKEETVEHDWQDYDIENDIEEVSVPTTENEGKTVDITEPAGIETLETAEDILRKYGPYDPRKDLEFYKFPSLNLLKTYDNETTPIINRDEQQNNANRIVTSLRNYGVEIESIKATVGPTVTLYEVVPKAGVKISKIQALEADIMLSLSAVGIRIIAPMPGKGTVGIEVPNENPQVVSMHSVIASKKFQEEKKMRLPIAIGRTITNEVFMFDLAKTPHLLVAGATGQGKSVGLNAIITSLLYKKHPTELKLVLVDPKMVEFSIYKPLIKHYLAAMPDQEERDIIITDCQKVINTLNSLVIEMEDRYSLLADANCRNLEDYNEKFINRHLNPTKEVENVVTHNWVKHHFMPYIVIVIDEYGDFIMQAGKEVERPIQRLAQKARAVGMHMILATQRPDVKIITGTIKANIPTRIAFRTQSVVDSRTVLDAKGADQLIGKGDMLYSGSGNLTRIQCAFVDTPEVEELVKHINSQQGFSNFYLLPEYVPEGSEDQDNRQVDIKHLDSLFMEVARYVVTKQEGSTSRLQRAFEIGYNRAGKLSDQLEATGIVGPNKGSKGRDVLIQDMESLERIFEKLNLK